MGLSYKSECDGCPTVEQNSIAYDNAIIFGQLELAGNIQSETDSLTMSCEAGSRYDVNRDAFVCRAGELVVSSEVYE